MIGSKTRKTIDPIFEQWKTEMANRSFSRYMDAPSVSDSWVHWLIDASLDPKKKQKWFSNKLDNWLNDLKKDKRLFKNQWHWLARLTSDLPDSKRLVQKYPVFYETALPAVASANDLLGIFRCGGLKKMNAGLSLNVAMEVWKEHLHLIMPDPADAYKSDYTDHAAWCKALHVLNQNSYKSLLLSLNKWFNLLYRQKYNKIKTGYLKRLWLLNEKASFTDRDGRFEGTILDVEENGILIIKTGPDSIRKYDFREVSFPW